MTDEITEFSERSGIKVRTDIPGARCTTFSVGGPIRALVEPDSESELISSIKALHALKFSYRVLGCGSNLLIPDSGVPSFVVRLGRGFRFCRDLGNETFEIGGATALMTLSRDLSEKGFSGLEFAGGIPASFGGAARMNAGAHSGEISQVLIDLSLVLPDGTTQVVTPANLSFSYRHSGIPEGAIVQKAKIKLNKGDPERSRELRARYLEERKSRQPLTMPSAGSVFKNPAPDRTAGFLVEKVGLKGHAIGGAEVSTLHGNWIVNPKRNATAQDVTSLVKYCRQIVQEMEGVELCPEVICW